MAKKIKYIVCCAGETTKDVGYTETLNDTPANAMLDARFAVLANPVVSMPPYSVDDTDGADTCDFRVTAVARTFLAVQLIGAVSGTTPTLDGKIQESVDGATWTDVDGATFTQVTSGNECQSIRFTSSKRYLRHRRAVAGTNPTFLFCATIQEVNPGSW